MLATKGRNGQPNETEKWITGGDLRVPLIASVGPQGTLKRKQARFLDEAEKTIRHFAQDSLLSETRKKRNKTPRDANAGALIIKSF